jgi:hypothetical protein
MGMKQPPVHRLLDANLLRGSVLITFEDGRMAIYSADLLYATIPQAEEVIDQDPEAEWED